jgi:MFS family permease
MRAMTDAAPLARFDGARMIGVAALVQAVATPLFGAYGVLQQPLLDEFDTDTAHLGLGMSLAILSMALSAPLLGRVFDRGPLRLVMLAGVGVMLGAVFGLSRGTALWQLALCLPLVTLGLGMYGMLPAQVILVNWFVLRRGTALGRAAVGGSVGALIVPVATAWLSRAFGWRTALLLLALAAAAIATPVIALFVVKRPEDVGQTPDGLPQVNEGQASEARSEPEASGVLGTAARSEPRANEVTGFLRDPNFWWIGIGAGLALSVSVATLFLVLHLEQCGIERTQAALVPSLMALFGILGKLAAGAAIDRVDARGVVIAALALHALGWGIVATQTSFFAFLLAAAPLGLGGGGFLPLPPVLQGRCFGRDAIGRVSGLHALLGLPVLLAAAPLVGLLEARTGSFTLPFLGLAFVLALAAACIARVRPPRTQGG